MDSRTSSGSSGGGGGSGHSRLFGRSGGLLDDNDHGVLDITRGRYGGVGGSGGGLDGGTGNDASGSAGGGSFARGLLFEVREFYGPTRIVVELVSGGTGGGGGVGGGNAGGNVLGRCEARLAEALVRRGGGSGMAKARPVFGLEHGEKALLLVLASIRPGLGGGCSCFVFFVFLCQCRRGDWAGGLSSCVITWYCC